MSNHTEEGRVKDVGWRVIRDISRKQDSNGTYLEGYYLRRPTGIECGYQRVYVISPFYGPLDDYWHVVENEEVEGKAWLETANSLFEQKKYNEALEAYNNAIELFPDLSEAWNGQGICLYWLGRYDEAMEAYNRSVDLNPNNAQAWCDKANLHTILSAIHRNKGREAATMMVKCKK